MEFETLKETLSEILNIQAKAVSNKSTIPILSNVLLKADGNKLYLSTTNLEINIISWIGAEVTKSGSTTVSLKRFLEYINTLSVGNIKLSFDANELTVISKNSKAVFTTIPASEFPKVSAIKEAPLCAINSVSFFDAITSVSFSASHDDTRPTFTGVYVEVGQNYVDFVAIDGFRMSKKKILIETGVASEISFIIPASYIDEIARISPDSAEDVKLFVIGNKNQLGLRYKNTDFVIRLIEGVYPEYSRVIPQEFTTDIVINRQELMEAVKTASIFSSQKEIGKTQIDISEHEVTLKSFQKEIGENETKIACDVTGESGSITYNSRFLLDAISHFSTENIVMRVVLKQEKPSVLYNSATSKKDPFAFDDSYFNLMTPIKIEQG
jgi:DNA polymerase-3 subunit beta